MTDSTTGYPDESLGEAASTSKFLSGLSLLLRLAIAQVFFIAAMGKITDPEAFSFAIDKFQIPGFTIQEGSSNTLVVAATFLVPWLEVVVGFLLASGLWTRPAATLYLLLMAGFTAAIYSTMQRGIVLSECGCFGDLQGFCTGPVGECNLIQNGVLGGAALLVLILGGGRASFDALIQRGETDERPIEPGEDDDVTFA